MSDGVKLAIHYICTGNYRTFWLGFYHSAERNLFPGIKKQYFVYCDSPVKESHNIKWVQQEQLGWPQIAVQRYAIFQKNRRLWQDFDYDLFFNANCKIVSTIRFDEMKPGQDDFISVCPHPGPVRDHLPIDELPYERDPRSVAAVPYGQGKDYIQSGVFCARKDSFSKLVDDLVARTNVDTANGVIAVWHDESQLNAYLIGKRYRLLTPDFIYPESWDLPYKPRILVRNKMKFGGHDFLRGLSGQRVKGSLSKEIKGLVKSILRRFIGKR